MEITKNNFEEKLPLVKEEIDKCDFLTIDTELTGLYSEDSTSHAFDTMEERYNKLRQQCSPFLVTQYGVSTFKYHATEKKFTHSDFNFYIFPNQQIKQAPDHRFLCQASSFHFLASNGFNFNKVIYEGIPYLRYDHEEKLREDITNKYHIQRKALNDSLEKVSSHREIKIPDEHKEFIAQINKQVDSFMEDASQNVLNLDPCSGYRRKLIFETVRNKHPTGIDMESVPNADNDRYISITKATKEDKLKKLAAKEEVEMMDIDEGVGFRKVIEYISASKKLVIGHHMYLDMMHTINRFCHALPESLQEYKEMLHLVFPYLVDTKCLASSEQIRPLLEKTSLEDIVKSMEKKEFSLPPIEISEGLEGYHLSQSKAHEAGFDTFLTGISFIGLTRKLASLQSENCGIINSSTSTISPYMNRFYVLRHFDIPTINICGPDPEPSRDNVFHVTFPKEWKTSDLIELFLPYGEIYINWLNDTSALIALRSFGNVLKAKEELLGKNKKNCGYCVRTYSDYQRVEKLFNMKKKEDFEKPKQSPRVELKKKRRDGPNSSLMYSILEADEMEAESTPSNENNGEAESLAPASKKSKKTSNCIESGEVSSTFQEGNDW